ncbi:hypothetical protein Pst134EA_015366 [Puccinia striiformis f. sp. tritici]|uniref:hypothetical protein n=1 Tax=Puccinia striiformis f. sp. tritici TaxID=168172 RepID=UPI002007D96A|nr:hypothetical protein Pst134EA_015366 [Puccinia striiformis f. sp. tritici]KAH9463281.1 hypothetical protein Pst134EA_015366 [Puccinia striiformis f. sp. tritici]
MLNPTDQNKGNGPSGGNTPTMAAHPTQVVTVDQLARLLEAIVPTESRLRIHLRIER